MYVKYGNEFAEICRRVGKEEDAAIAQKAVEEMYQSARPMRGSLCGPRWVRLYSKERRRCSKRGAAIEQKAVEEMYQAVLDAGWDGEWFLRAYDATSQKVGSHECKEGLIFIEP